MQLPIIPPRGLRKPTGSPRINWADPITTGLAVAFDLNGAPFDLVNGAMSADSVSPPTGTGNSLLNWKPSIGGFGYTGASSTFQCFRKQLIPGAGATSQLTCVAYVNYVSAANDQGILSYNTPNSGTSAWLDLIVPTASAKARMEVYSGSFTSVLGANALTSGNDYVLGGRLTGAELSVWVSGAKSNSSAFSSTLTAMTQDPGIGCHGGLNNYWRGVIYYVFYWARPLSDVEMLRLGRDPSCFLIYPEDDIFAELVGVAAGGFTAKFRRTLSPIGSRVGSRQTHGWGA